MANTFLNSDVAYMLLLYGHKFLIFLIELSAFMLIELKPIIDWIHKKTGF